jgi:hypothetical protein
LSVILVKPDNGDKGWAFVKRLLTMNTATQVLEKNHFPPPQNRATSLRMSENDRKRSRLLMLFLAAGLVLAILAPVAVLAA